MRPIFIRTAPISDRRTYAVKRMNEAAQRLLRAETVAEEIQAGHWVLAWAVAAGVRPSSRLAGASLTPFGLLNLH